MDALRTIVSGRSRGLYSSETYILAAFQAGCFDIARLLQSVARFEA